MARAGRRRRGTETSVVRPPAGERTRAGSGRARHILSSVRPRVREPESEATPRSVARFSHRVWGSGVARIHDRQSRLPVRRKAAGVAAGAVAAWRPCDASHFWMPHAILASEIVRNISLRALKGWHGRCRVKECEVEKDPTGLSSGPIALTPSPSPPGRSPPSARRNPPKALSGCFFARCRHGRPPFPDRTLPRTRPALPRAFSFLIRFCP